jgi:hypothetical protein
MPSSFLFLFSDTGIEPKVLWMASKLSTTELQPQPLCLRVFYYYVCIRYRPSFHVIKILYIILHLLLDYFFIANLYNFYYNCIIDNWYAVCYYDH